MDKLKEAQAKRKELLNEIGELGEMRRGSVVEQYYEVTNQGGEVVRQGPYFLYSYKDQGKTVSRRLSGPGEAQRVREEIEEFRRFEQLSAQLVEISQRICDLKAVADAAADEGSPEKKLRRRSGRRFSGRSRS